MVSMRILVAFYSRTGHTRKLGRRIAKELKADTDEIHDLTDRSGILGWLAAGRDAWKHNPTEIRFRKNPEKYDLVIVGTPIWAATQAPATMVYLERHKIKRVAFFCTYGGSAGKCFEDMQKDSKKPAATLGLRDKEVESRESLAKIKKFCRKLKKK